MQTTPEAVHPHPPALTNARALARLLDTSLRVPGTRFRFGLDPILGLIPGIGDIAGVLLSTWIVFAAARLGVPRATLTRMGANIAVEAVVGMVPLLGDLFDAGWRANARNVSLMEAYLSDPVRTSRSSNRWLMTVAAGIGAGLLLLVAGAAWLIVELAGALGIG